MEEYYIRNEGYLGNALMWWKLGGGYTCDIRQAEKFSREQAKRICQRKEDSAYLVSYIDGLTEAHKLIVDCQYVDSSERMWA